MQERNRIIRVYHLQENRIRRRDAGGDEQGGPVGARNSVACGFRFQRRKNGEESKMDPEGSGARTEKHGPAEAFPGRRLIDGERERMLYGSVRHDSGSVKLAVLPRGGPADMKSALTFSSSATDRTSATEVSGA